MTTRRTAAAAALLLATLTACSSGGQPTTGTGSVASCEKAMRKAFDQATKEPSAPEVTKTPPACQGISDAELKDLAGKILKEKVGEALNPGGTEQDTPDLALGKAYKYKDGLTVSVDSIDEITQFSEYDEPRPDKTTVFRVTWTIDNGSSKPVNLDDLFATVQGATNGGTATPFYIEKGSKQMTGRLAPGVKTQKTGEYSLADQYGKKILISLDRNSEDMDILTTAPAWTGTIG